VIPYGKRRPVAVRWEPIDSYTLLYLFLTDSPLSMTEVYVSLYLGVVKPQLTTVPDICFGALSEDALRWPLTRDSHLKYHQYSLECHATNTVAYYCIHMHYAYLKSMTSYQKSDSVDRCVGLFRLLAEQ